MIGDHNPVCGMPTGRAGNDRLSGGTGADQLHGDSYTDSGDPVVDSGDGNDVCDGGREADTGASCESSISIP
jgi:Ca2+-binding RTX toxin-like protein